MPQKIIDLSHPIHSSMPPWPGTPSVEVKYLDRASSSRPDERHSNSSRFAMNIHCGTHLDAPFHFFDSGKTVDQIPLSQTYGLATLLRLAGKTAGTHITRGDLDPFETKLRRHPKVILQTGWSSRWMQHDFFTAFPDITPDAAQFLVECGVELLGVETASVDSHPNETHVVLLGNNVVIVECLARLDFIPGDEFLFSAIPLNLEGRDGSPVRAVGIVDV